ncbi:hypothetical protein AMTRI_Chr01g109180 [Amborella trichopoda]
MKHWEPVPAAQEASAGYKGVTTTQFELAHTETPAVVIAYHSDHPSVTDFFAGFIFCSFGLLWNATLFDLTFTKENLGTIFYWFRFPQSKKSAPYHRCY